MHNGRCTREQMESCVTHIGPNHLGRYWQRKGTRTDADSVDSYRMQLHLNDRSNTYRLGLHGLYLGLVEPDDEQHSRTVGPVVPSI